MATVFQKSTGNSFPHNLNLNNFTSSSFNPSFLLPLINGFEIPNITSAVARCSTNYRWSSLLKTRTTEKNRRQIPQRKVHACLSHRSSSDPYRSHPRPLLHHHCATREPHLNVRFGLLVVIILLDTSCPISCISPRTCFFFAYYKCLSSLPVSRGWSLELPNLALLAPLCLSNL